ncbi:glycosyltransferase family 4 protein [uncultured Proteiniphilum sp.]|uniref:glycosyltransferase family 4 protein n=1 Tax=uncultured Proteiniphilum sp. TaxID=497637 RepID=UPI00262DB939|nr:glycosyltransferase family 4 protein [uncultured Proteiniphilum sp.]
MSKIFQLISSVQLGGAEIVAFNLAEYGGYNLPDPTEIAVVELYRTKNSYADTKRRELENKNIRIITLHKGLKRSSLMLGPLRLIFLILKEKPRVIHSHTDLPDFVLSVAMRTFRFFHLPFPRVVRTIHNTQLWRTHHKLGRITESPYTNEPVIAVSSYAMNAYEQLRKKYGLPVSPDRQIIYNGCAVPQQRQHPFKIDKEKINIAFCGRFEDYKGMETLIPVITEMGRLYPYLFLFHLIGDGTYKKQLLQLSQQREDVFLYDPIPNVSSMFHAFDYLLMPSHFEGLGLISVEASLAGVPVIASHAPGLDETLPENWPLKFRLDKKEELYAIFENIKNRMYGRGELQKIAFDFVSTRFSRNKMIQSYNTLYNKMI